MEICLPSVLLKSSLFFCNESSYGNRVEHSSQKIWAQCSTRWPSAQHFRSIIQPNYHKALQSTGVLTNGADAAQIASSFGVPTTAKTIIRRVLQLPLPSEGEVAKVGRDEWAWKKGHHYGTILVDLEKRRIVQLLADRSAETSTAWLRTHPEIDLVSRDRGKIFRDAATQGAPQAKQVTDRFHLQKNFAEALEKFFRKQEHVLKKATQRSTGKAHPAERGAVPENVSRERRARHRQRVSLHKRIWKLYREGYHKEQIAKARRSQFEQCLSCPRTRNASTSTTTISLFFHR